MVTAWAYGHDFSRLNTRSDGPINEIGVRTLDCGRQRFSLCNVVNREPSWHGHTLVRRVPDRGCPRRTEVSPRLLERPGSSGKAASADASGMHYMVTIT